MKITFVSVLALTGSFLLLFLSIFPGVMDDMILFAFLTSCLWLPTLVVGAIIYTTRLSSAEARAKSVKPEVGPSDEFAGLAEPGTTQPRRMAVMWAVVALNLVLLLFEVPRRLVFAVSRPWFEPYVASLPGAGTRGKELGRQLGLYHVDRVASDVGGGVYFRTHSSRDGLGPDTISYGFAYRPNPQGTPFGRAGYSRSHLFGPWYSFSTSNDY